MAIVASTNEMLFDLRDIKWSLEKHLGSEYADTVEDIINNNYISIDEYEKEVKRMEIKSDYYYHYIIDIHNQLNEIMDYILDAKRLNRDKIFNWLSTIWRDIHQNF